jgi:predicted O-methyltransferase YrrM
MIDAGRRWLREKWAKLDLMGQWHAFTGCDPFTRGTKPIFRWIKGDGRDDAVTAAALAQATRIFGYQVDYGLLTQGISADRARRILSHAHVPVDWRPISARDNPELAKLLHAAGCPDQHFGYWWKWFPERVRRRAPEWILDGDMVITGKPEWFERWAAGLDRVRMAATSESPEKDYHIYGRYSHLVDPSLKLYSGLVSLPPGLRYMTSVKRVLNAQPLAVPHHGQKEFCEQGVMVAALQKHNPLPIPLDQFPFARAFQPALDFGDQPGPYAPWGYHFGNSFVMENPHFQALQDAGVIDRPQERDAIAKATWLSGGWGQWGFSGWGMTEGVARVFVQHLGDITGRRVLELGTSRGFLSLILCQLGARVTTVDTFDRGAKTNLQGLAAEVVVMSAQAYLQKNGTVFDAICIDLHGNSWRTWQSLWPRVAKRVAVGGKVLIDNATLHTLKEWAHEDGVYRLFEHLRRDPAWKCTLIEQPLPGVLVLERVA